MTSNIEPLMGISPNSTEMVPEWSPIEIVQMVLISCINRSRGKKNRFSKCIFQKSSCLKLQGPELSNLVYIASSRSSLPIFGYNNIMASP